MEIDTSLICNSMKKKIIIVSVLCVVISACFLLFRKTEVIFLQHVEGVTDIVVKKFPITKIGRISWWKDNKFVLKDKYGIPKRDKNGVYFIAIWDGSEGFKKIAEADNPSWYSFSGNDLFCFDEIKSENRCVEHIILMKIISIKEGEVDYIIDGDYIK